MRLRASLSSNAAISRMDSTLMHAHHAPAAARAQRQVAIYDRNGKLLEQLHLPPAEVAASDPKQSCCLQLQVGLHNANHGVQG